MCPISNIQEHNNYVIAPYNMLFEKRRLFCQLEYGMLKKST